MHTISTEKEIRDMNAQQIIERAKEYYNSIKEGKASRNDYEYLTLCKIQYKQLTGSQLTNQTIERS